MKRSRVRWGVVLGMVCAPIVMASSNVAAPRATDPSIVIYTAAKDGSVGDVMCTIPFIESAVDFTNDDFGCVNDDAYFFSITDAPSAADIWLLSEKNCDVDNAAADWVFKLKTTNKVVNTEPLRIKGLSAFITGGQFTPAVVIKGLQLVGGFINDNHIDGKLSCVKIKPSMKDTSVVTEASRPSVERVAGNTVASSSAVAAGATITLYGSQGSEQCSMAFTDYVHRFAKWVDGNGNNREPTNPGGCPNDDAYYFSLRNVPSASTISFSSEAACTLEKSQSDWIFELKTTQSNLSTGQIRLSGFSGLTNNKPLPPPDKGLLMVDNFHRSGNVDGKLSCIKIDLSLPDIP